MQNEGELLANPGPVEADVHCDRTLERPKGRSLRQAREDLMANIDKGVVCPCCGQLAKVYKRKLNKKMAEWLVWLVGKYLHSTGHIPSNWIDVKESRVRGGDYAKLALWGLAKRKPVEEGAKSRTSGLWKPTPIGIDFAIGRRRAPSHLFVFNNSVVGESETTISIKEAMGEGFDYQDVYYWSSGEDIRTP